MNLFICFTPLHILICKKIIENYHNEELEILALFSNNDTKMKYYIKKIFPNQTNVKIINFNQYSIPSLFLTGLKLRIMEFKFNKIFTAHINNLFIRALLKNSEYKELYSFDDGLANINYNGFLYKRELLDSANFKNKIKRYIKNIFFGLSDGDYNIYKKKIVTHYTIFPNMPNLIKNTKDIKLFNENFSDKQDRKKTIKLFLGQPIYEKELEKNRILIEEMIEKFKIDLYLPHPREEYIIKNVKYIDTKLIAEDYIISQLQKDKTINFEIYGFFTTALFTLSNLNILKLNAIFIQNDEVFENVKSLYNIMQKLNIKVINL